jgi:hypothetical protein
VFTFHRLDENIATVGFGVCVEDQPPMGWGLKATQSFVPGQLITQYDGIAMSKEEALEIHQRDPASTHHIISFAKWAINGLSHRESAKGYGGASFANHSPNSPNSEFYVDHDGLVFLKALSPIEPGDWIMTDYGDRFLTSAISNLNVK